MVDQKKKRRKRNSDGDENEEQEHYCLSEFSGKLRTVVQAGTMCFKVYLCTEDPFPKKSAEIAMAEKVWNDICKQMKFNEEITNKICKTMSSIIISFISINNFNAL